jgi:hypothetical protein
MLEKLVVESDIREDELLLKDLSECTDPYGDTIEPDIIDDESLKEFELAAVYDVACC